MQEKLKVGVTGASGFAGRRFMEYNRERFSLKELNLRNRPLSETAVASLDAIVHFAGLAHQMKPVPDELYYKVNVELTDELVGLAKNAGVRHFVYISSTKVYGDEQNGILDENSACSPSDAYGRSKLMAEKLILSRSDENFTVAVVRPPVIYGPGVKGNILKLLYLAQRKRPLPFRRIDNQRSVVFVDNLIEMINTIIGQRVGGIFIAGDRAPVSTEKLVSSMQLAFHGRTFLFAIPSIGRKLIEWTRPALYMRLFGSFVISNAGSNKRLGFTPPVTIEEGIAETVNWFRDHQNGNQ